MQGWNNIGIVDVVSIYTEAMGLSVHQLYWAMLDKQTILSWVAIVIDIPTAAWVMFLNVYWQSLTLAKC